MAEGDVGFEDAPVVGFAEGFERRVEVVVDAAGVAEVGVVAEQAELPHLGEAVGLAEVGEVLPAQHVAHGGGVIQRMKNDVILIGKQELVGIEQEDPVGCGALDNVGVGGGEVVDPREVIDGRAERLGGFDGVIRGAGVGDEEGVGDGLDGADRAGEVVGVVLDDEAGGEVVQGLLGS